MLAYKIAFFWFVIYRTHSLQSNESYIVSLSSKTVTCNFVTVYHFVVCDCFKYVLSESDTHEEYNGI